MGNCLCNKKSDNDPSSTYRPSLSTQHTNRELTSSNLSSHQRLVQNPQNRLSLQTQDNEILKRNLSGLSTVSEFKPKLQSNIGQANVSTQVASNLGSDRKPVQNPQNRLSLQTQDNEILKRNLSGLSTVSEFKPKLQSNIGQANVSTQVASNLGGVRRPVQNPQNRLILQTQNNHILKRNLSTVSESKPNPQSNIGQINVSTQVASNLGGDRRPVQNPQNRLILQTQNNDILKRNLSTVSKSKPNPQSNISQINVSTQVASNLGGDRRPVQNPQNRLILQTQNNHILKRNLLGLSTVSELKPYPQMYIAQTNVSTQVASNLGRDRRSVQSQQNGLNLQTQNNQIFKNSYSLNVPTFYASTNSTFSSDEPRAEQEKSKRRDQFQQKPKWPREERQLSPPILRLLKLVYNENSVILDDQKIAFHYYRNLKTKLNLLKPYEPAYPKICNYLKNTHGPTHNFNLSILNIYSTYRWGVFHDFKINKKLIGNLKLLWHGSELKNFPSILSNGLLTQPPSHVKTTGKMFGNGIYFADIVTKAAQYCKVDRSNPYGILILAQVALGEEYIRTKSDYITSLPYGKNSVKALGRYQPNDSESIRMFGMEIPIGKPILQPYLNTSLQYNEYIVYDINQIFIEYLVLVKFNY